MRKGLSYGDGTIMDPRDGTVYRALMQLSPNGTQLEVRGYFGIAMLGRSQIWNVCLTTRWIPCRPLLAF